MRMTICVGGMVGYELKEGTTREEKRDGRVVSSLWRGKTGPWGV